MKVELLVGEIKAVETDDPNGAFEVILSAPTLDRDGEVIDAKAFEPLPDHITFDVDHGMTVSTTIGSGTPRYDGDLLKVAGTFSSIPRAQEVRTLVTEGHVRTTSVAFMNAKRTVKDGVPHIVKAELLNGAFVAVPSNREALIVAAKSARRPADAVPGLKAIEGSFEERSDNLRDAIRSANPDAWWVWVIATFDDHVVYECDARDGSSRFTVTYEIGEDGAITLGVAEPVDIVEVVTPAKADDHVDDTKTSSDPDPAAALAAAAPASETPAADGGARIRVAIAEGEAALALLG